MKYIVRSGMNDFQNVTEEQLLEELLAGDLTTTCRERATRMLKDAKSRATTGLPIATQEDVFWLLGAPSDPGCYNTGVVTPPIVPATPTPATPTASSSSTGIPWWVWALGGLGLVLVISD